MKKYRMAIVLGVSGLLAIVALLALFATTSLDANAKDKVKDKDKDSKHFAKSLSIVSVTHPSPSFQGTNPYPTFPQAGQELVAVTIDFDRDFKDHIRSSETGEVYLTELGSTQAYNTVDTVVQPSEGPGKKPARQVTFVFSVPQNSKALTLHYGALYSLSLP